MKPEHTTDGDVPRDLVTEILSIVRAYDDWPARDKLDAGTPIAIMVGLLKRAAVVLSAPRLRGETASPPARDVTVALESILAEAAAFSEGHEHSDTFFHIQGLATAALRRLAAYEPADYVSASSPPASVPDGAQEWMWQAARYIMAEFGLGTAAHRLKAQKVMSIIAEHAPPSPPPSTPAGDLDAVVEQIVVDLFINGAGQRAERLVLTDVHGRDLGGWGLGPLVDRIKDALRAALKER